MSCFGEKLKAAGWVGKRFRPSGFLESQASMWVSWNSKHMSTWETLKPWRLHALSPPGGKKRRSSWRENGNVCEVPLSVLEVLESELVHSVQGSLCRVF